MKRLICRAIYSIRWYRWLHSSGPTASQRRAMYWSVWGMDQASRRIIYRRAYEEWQAREPQWEWPGEPLYPNRQAHLRQYAARILRASDAGSKS